MKKEFKILPPQMPDYIDYETGVIGRKQDGINPSGNRIPIESLSESEANEYAELMKNTFLEYWVQKCTSK